MLNCAWAAVPSVPGLISAGSGHHRRMAKPTAYSAQVKAVKTLLRGADQRVKLSVLQRRLKDLRERKGVQDTLIDRAGAMVLLGLPYEKVKDLALIDPPPHPFKVPVVQALPKLPRGRPSAKVSAERKQLTVKRGRGKPPAVATVSEVLDWAEALIKSGHLETLIGTWNQKRGPDYTIDMTLAKVPFHLSHDTERVRTIIDGQLLGAGQIIDALRRPRGRVLGFMTLANALLDYEWADTGLQRAIAEVYAEHLENKASLIRERVAKDVSDTRHDRLKSKTPPASGKSLIRRA